MSGEEVIKRGLELLGDGRRSGLRGWSGRSAGADIGATGTSPSAETGSGAVTVTGY